MLPVDDEALSRYEEALGAAFGVDGDGRHYLAEGEFTITRLLEFYSGTDDSKVTMLGEAGGVPVYEHPDPAYTRDDLIRALIAEVRSLRQAQAAK